MKKIFNIMMCLVVAAFVASCSDDVDNPYAHTSSIVITKTNLFFEATASDAGRIAFTSNGNVTVSTSAPWAKAELKNDSVFVSVEQNDTRYSRSASVVLRANNDSVEVALVQKGITLRMETTSLVAKTNDATTVVCDYESNVAMQVVEKPEWVNVSLADGKVSVNFDANNTGSFRRGVVVMRSENFVDSINVCQYDFEKDIKGVYKLTYYRDTTYTTTRTINATVKDDVITLSGMNLNLPYTFDDKTMSIVLTAGAYSGKTAGSFIYAMFGDAKNEYYSSYNTDVTLSAQLSHDADGNIVAPFITEYPGIVFESIILSKFKEKDFVEANYAGLYQVLYKPTLTRVLTK